MGTKTPRSADPAAARAYYGEWIKRPGSRELKRAADKRARAKPGARERRNARRRELRSERGRAAPARTAKCAACGGEFYLKRGPGRPRIYCSKCVSAFVRSDRKCKRCGRIIDRWRSRLTCRHCGALWMRGRPLG